MAKLYCEITSDKGGRTVSKGDNDSIQVTVRVKNEIVGYIYIDYLHDKHNHGTELDEYLVQWHSANYDDPIIIQQGNI